jgi:DNA-binding MarR family transcriptional regulator
MRVSRSPRQSVAQPRSQGDTDRKRPATPTALIEAQLSPQGEPVLGLYLHVAYHTVMATFGSKVGRGDVTPAMIGVVALLAENPGISQAKLARLIGLERATIGTTVARAIAAGLVDRRHANDDGRSYALFLSPRGERMLDTLRRRIADHEKTAGGHLTASERRALRTLLHKLVYG